MTAQMGLGSIRRLGPRRLRQAVLFATALSPLALGAPSPVYAAGPICTGSTFSGGGIASAAIASGRLLMWGVDAVGELGQGQFSGLQPIPVQVTTRTGLTTVQGVWLGPQSSFATDGSGNAWAWGDNEFFEAGFAAPQFAVFPTRIVGPTHVVNIAPGPQHSLAVTADGSVWGWGFSGSGELNFTSPFPQTTPLLLPGIGGVASAAAGDQFSLLLMKDGTVFGMGSNGQGQLGLGFTGFTTFTQVPGLSNIVGLAAGTGASFLVALDASGNVFTSGENAGGQQGVGTITPNEPQRTVHQVPGLSGVVAVSAGWEHVLALTAHGTVMAWGANFDGQLGNGGTSLANGTPTAVQFPAGVNVVAIAAGTFSSMALDDQGGLWIWGDDSAAEVGNGAIGPPVTTPFKVTALPTIAPACVPQLPRTYIPSRDGYSFVNGAPPAGDPNPFIAPTYDQMRNYYPDSAGQMFNSDGSHTKVGQLFYDKLFAPTFTEGLCYGMATSDTFLYNRSSIHPETYQRWSAFKDPLRPDTLSPPLDSAGDLTIADFIRRYHARQLGELGAGTSGAVWAQYGFDVGINLNRTNGNLAAFDAIAARVKTAPVVVAFGPSPFIALGGPAIDPTTHLPVPLPDPARWGALYNSSHAVVAYATSVMADGTRVIKVYDPSSVTSDGQTVIDQSEIHVAPDGGVQLIDFGGGGSGGKPAAWIGGGTASEGQPGDWILMPLPDFAFSERGVGTGPDNRHWVVDPAIALLLLLSNQPVILPPGVPIFTFNGQSPARLAEQLPQGAGYDGVVAAGATGASTSLTVNSHLVTVTQTDSGAAGSTHHIAIDPTATSIHLDSASQLEMFNLEIAADYLPAYSRSILMSGASLSVAQSLDVTSDAQTSRLDLSSSSPHESQVSTTFEQTGANAGSATVLVTLPANGLAAEVSVFDWNGLGSSLIYEVIDPQGTPTGQVLQGNASQLATQVAADFASLQSTIASIPDAGLRNALQAKVASAQDSFSRGQTQAAANAIHALRNQISAQTDKGLDAATASQLRALSADALILLNAS